MYTAEMAEHALGVFGALASILNDDPRDWEAMPPYLIFVVPGEPLPLYGLFDHDEFDLPRLALFRGRDAERGFHAALGEGDSSARDDAELVVLMWDQLGELSPDQAHLMRAIGAATKKSRLVPHVTQKRPRAAPTSAGAAEWALVLRILRALIRTLKDGSPDAFESPAKDRRLTLVIDGTLASPIVHTEWRPCAELPSPSAKFADEPEDRDPETASPEDWDEVDDELIRFILSEIEAEGTDPRPLLNRYFGDFNPFDKKTPAETEEVAVAFMYWRIPYGRGGNGHGRTCLENLLDVDLPPAELAITERWLQSSPSFWWVRQIRKKSEITVEDTLGGTTFVFHSPAQAAKLVKNRIYPAAVIQVRNTIRLRPMGPKLAPDRYDDALSFLRRRRFTPTIGGLAKTPHMLGRLWEFVDADENGPTRQLRLLK